MRNKLGHRHCLFHFFLLGRQQTAATLGSESIGEKLLHLVVPAIHSQVIHILYTVIDRIHIGFRCACTKRNQIEFTDYHGYEHIYHAGRGINPFPCGSYYNIVILELLGNHGNKWQTRRTLCLITTN